VPSERPWQVLYGDGSAAQGTTYLDRVSLSANLSVARQPVGAATAVSAEFTSDPFLSGILGLGFSKGSSSSALRPYRMPTFIENLAPQLERPVFAADLRAASPGRFSFGGVDPDGYTGRITWEKVSAESPYWLFNVRASQVTVTAGGSNETKTKTKTKTVRHAGKAGVLRAIADTGTSLVMLPRRMVDEYYAAVPGARYDEKWAGVLVPCRARLPDWSFFVGEEVEGEQESEQHVGTVPGRYINFGPVNGTHCFGGIQSADGFGFAVFGDVLLKAQYVVFDVGNMRIGFANKKLAT